MDGHRNCYVPDREKKFKPDWLKLQNILSYKKEVSMMTFVVNKMKKISK